MAQRYSSVTSTLSVLFASSVRGSSWSAGSDSHFAARPDQQLTCKHYALICRESFCDDHIVTLTLAQIDWAQFGTIVRLDHIDKRPLLADLCGLIGNQDGCLFRRQDELYVHELSRPEMVVRVVDGGPQVDCAAAVLHRVVKEFNSANSRCTFLVRRKPNQRLQTTACHLLLDFGKIALRDGEVRIDWVQPLNGKQGACVRLHHVA